MNIAVLQLPIDPSGGCGAATRAAHGRPEPQTEIRTWLVALNRSTCSLSP